MSPSQIPKTSQKEIHGETSLAVQWLRLCTCTAEGAGSIPGWGTKILPAARCGQKKKKKRNTWGTVNHILKSQICQGWDFEFQQNSLHEWLISGAGTSCDDYR